MAERHGLRARDVDRLWTMSRLDEAFTDGQLSVPEHEERVAHARSARSLAELDTLTGDLQCHEVVPASASPVKRPRRRTARRRRWVVAGMAIVATVAVGGTAVVWSNDTGPGAAVSSYSNPVASRLVGGPMYTSDGLTELVGAIRARFGTTVVEGMHVYKDSAVVHVYEADSPVGVAQYTYTRGGEFHGRQVYSGRAVASVPGERVDVAKLDTQRIADLIASAPDRLRLTTAKLAPASSFRVTVGGDDGGEVWIGVNDMSVDSHLVAHLDGRIMGEHPCGWGC